MAECGAGDVEPGYFLETLADIFARWLERWRTYGLPPVRSQWLKYAHPKGTMLKAHLPDGTAIEGTLADLGQDGALILRLVDGTSHVIHAGDIFLILGRDHAACHRRRKHQRRFCLGGTRSNSLSLEDCHRRPADSRRICRVA